MFSESFIVGLAKTQFDSNFFFFSNLTLSNLEIIQYIFSRNDVFSF